MTTPLLLLLAVLMGACTEIAGNHGVSWVNEPSADQFEEAQEYIPELCAPTPLSFKPSTSVHALTPGHIAALHTLGTPPSQRNKASRVFGQLAEILAMFNPALEAKIEAFPVPRSLLQEAQELANSWIQQEDNWRILVIFIPGDTICPCFTSVEEKVKNTVLEVETALKLLQRKMRHTLVHLAVWSGPLDVETCRCSGGEVKDPLLQKVATLKVLQDSLSSLVENPTWDNKGDSFTVVMQPSPVILEEESHSGDTRSEQYHVALQLWKNVIQPPIDQAEVKNAQPVVIPCPTLKRPFLRTNVNTPNQLPAPRSQMILNMGSELPCTDRAPSPTIPRSVHELRPADIKVVASVGDSLTAANGVGAKTDSIILLINEYRGLSWSIGGDESLSTVMTLPNILREFNPSLTGFSTGIGNQNNPKAFLNVAVAGAKSGDMVGQVRTLVDKMKSDSRIDFNNDWKVITMFVGGNDICDHCTDSIQFSARNVVNRISEALDILHQEVPRAIVNLVEMLYISPLRALHQDTSLGCPTWFVNFICPCILKPKEGSVELQQIYDFNRAYQLAMRELIETGRYEQSENFTVVLQPFLRDIELPRLPDGRPDRSYFAPDCFHLSQKAHTVMAQALWNNMLEPVGAKTFSQNFTGGIPLKCPTETEPFFRTASNSNYTFSPPPTSAPNTDWGSDFTCVHTAPSDSVPTSAHKVRPADIKVVGAVGDSLTAGFGARAENLLGLRNEDRGVSWSIGGDDTLEIVTTLPNILKKFNPNLKGMSLGVGKDQTGFNMAISGAKISGIPGQVRTLIDTMKADPTVDFENDWKLVTLFIGGNDLCQYCTDRAAYSPKNYSHHMMTSLDMLYEEVPRMIVNVVEILEIEGLRKIKRNTLGCNLIQPLVCTCFLAPGENSPELAEMKRVNREMQVETTNLVYGGRYDGREDFAAVVQPFFRSSAIPLDSEGNPDLSFFSVDCFHFSERGQADMASSLWNNMMEPLNGKTSYTNFRSNRSNIKCPTEEHPFIFTRVNSMPSLSTTTLPTVDQTTAQYLPENCSGKVEAWLAAVLAVVGLLVGCTATGLLCYCKNKRSKRKRATMEMKNTTF